MPRLEDGAAIVTLEIGPMDLADGKRFAGLVGPEARHQIVVSAHVASGDILDVTRVVKYYVEPAGIVEVDPTGLVRPLAEGVVRVTAGHPTGLSASRELVVEGIARPPAVNFPNQIVPIFTKHGCNGGGCHGKSGGQNGFRLSLLGFVPDEDYEYLVKESRGRRLSAASPGRSLLIEKALGIVPHGGGARIEPGSVEVALLERWMLQGMPYGKADDPTVARIEVYPRTRVLGRGAELQLSVLATYSDGRTEDVTRQAQFEANDPEMAEVSPSGLLRTTDLAGDANIMVRYQGQVDVFRGLVPLGADTSGLPEPRNLVDEAVFAKLRLLGVPASELSDDATFLRRVSVDLTGRLPSAAEARAFLEDASPAKREALIDRLLDSPEYAECFANKWGSILRNKKLNQRYTRGTYAFHDWIRESFYQNKPYDVFVREILAASGDVTQHPPVAWYRSVRSATEQVEDTAQLFLGLRLQCARCHHHPFERWSEDDYYGFSAFFSRVGRKPGLSGIDDEPRIFHQRGKPRDRNPRTGRELAPTGLGAQPLDASSDIDPRHLLVDWMRGPSNPFFAPALVNRYWKHFFGRGIVEPEDDMRVTNPASNPELLAALSRSFVESGYDLKALIRTICRSATYQLSAIPNEHNAKDRRSFSRYYPKRLAAEVLFDGIQGVLAASGGFPGMPAGTRAIELPDSGAGNYFLTVFGKPEGNSSCECERSQDANLAQSLHLLNSQELQQKLAAGGGRADLLSKDARPDEEKVRELYLWAYARLPAKEEADTALEYLRGKEDRKAAYEDILWALINTKEFLFNH